MQAILVLDLFRFYTRVQHELRKNCYEKFMDHIDIFIFFRFLKCLSSSSFCVACIPTTIRIGSTFLLNRFLPFNNIFMDYWGCLRLGNTINFVLLDHIIEIFENIFSSKLNRWNQKLIRQWKKFVCLRLQYSYSLKNNNLGTYKLGRHDRRVR